MQCTVNTAAGKGDAGDGDAGDGDAGDGDAGDGEAGDGDAGDGDAGDGDAGDGDAGDGDAGDGDAGDGDAGDGDAGFQIGAGLYAVGRPVQKRNEEDSQIGTNHPCPSREGPYSTVFFGKPAHGPPHVAVGASGPIGGCRDESRTNNPDLDL